MCGHFARPAAEFSIFNLFIFFTYVGKKARPASKMPWAILTRLPSHEVTREPFFARLDIKYCFTCGK